MIAMRIQIERSIEFVFCLTLDLISGGDPRKLFRVGQVKKNSEI